MSSEDVKEIIKEIIEKRKEAFSTQIHGHKFKFESFMESEEGIKPDSFSNAMRYYGTRAALKTLSRK